MPIASIASSFASAPDGGTGSPPTSHTIVLPNRRPRTIASRPLRQHRRDRLRRLSPSPSPVALDEVHARDPVLAREPLGRLSPTFTAAPDPLLGRLRRETPHEDREAARPEEELVGLGAEVLEHERGQLPRPPRRRQRRAAPRSRSRTADWHYRRLPSPRYAWHTFRARLRTRPMYAARSVADSAPRASSRLNACDAFSTWS